MGAGSSDLVRKVAAEKYVQPAIHTGKTQFSIAVKDVMNDLIGQGFPASNYPQICTALRTGKFLRDNRLEIESVDGPPSGLSTTVVIHYRAAGLVDASPAGRNHSKSAKNATDTENPTETAAERAERLVNGLRGLLKDEIAAFGGTEAFMRWVRSDDDPRDEAIREAARIERSSR